MTTTRKIECNGKAFPIRMGWNAVRRIEEELKMPIQAVGAAMVGGRAGIRELGVVFWAGLETARLHEKSRPNPWTMEEVGDLIDTFGAETFFDQVYKELLAGITEAFPSVKKERKGSKKGGDKDPQVPAQTAGTGTDSSTQPPA